MDADAVGGELLGHDSRHQLVLQRHDAGLAVEHVHVGAEMGEDGSALAFGRLHIVDGRQGRDRFLCGANAAVMGAGYAFNETFGKM